MNEDMPWVDLTQEEIEGLSTKKHELTEYGKQKIKEMTTGQLMDTEKFQEEFAKSQVFDADKFAEENSIARNRRILDRYNIFYNTDIVHSTTDCYELYDEAEGHTLTVKLQADNGGVYLDSTRKIYDSEHRGITEYMSINNKDLAICVARRILELYGVN